MPWPPLLKTTFCQRLAEPDVAVRQLETLRRRAAYELSLRRASIRTLHRVRRQQGPLLSSGLKLNCKNIHFIFSNRVFDFVTVAIFVEYDPGMIIS